jgi:hypothetical protein
MVVPSKPKLRFYMEIVRRSPRMTPSKLSSRFPLAGDVSPNDSDPNNEKLTFLKLSEPGEWKDRFQSGWKIQFPAR